jgi:hypothetical protein
MKNSERVHNAMINQDGVSAHPHRFGGTEYRLGKREIGHIHGERLVDIPFPKPVRDAAIAEGKAEPHHILPDSGWVSIWLKSDQNVVDAIELLARSLELARRQVRNRQARTAAG